MTLCGHMKRLLSVSWLVFFFSVAHSEELEIEIIPTGQQEADFSRQLKALLDSPEVKSALKGKRYRVLKINPSAITRAPSRLTPVDSDSVLVAEIYDYTEDRLLKVTNDSGKATIREFDDTFHQPLPTQDEYMEAVEILKRDRALGAKIKKNQLIPYMAMPVLLDPLPGGGKRVLPIGLRATHLRSDHEIVAVDLSREKIERFTRKSPPGSIATSAICGPISSGQSLTNIGTPGSAVVVVKLKGSSEPLWKMHVTRPSASEGKWGSGIELREIYYKGRLILHRAHAPILNVDYIDNVCGPFRDPVNYENAFAVEGDEITSGILKTKTPPKTIFETKQDFGNYRGVAIFEDASQLVLMSELSAGWYRYVSEFRFYPDGTIKPIFKFDAVHNSCTCEDHNHHVYWRFDFDIDGAYPNLVEAYGSNGWRRVNSESKVTRDSNNQSWRIFNPESNRGFTITPGPYDEKSNAFGMGDAWILKYTAGEIDDRKFPDPKAIMIDSFLNQEPLNSRTDLVFWYGGHILHSENGRETPHTVGPTLKPF